MAAIVFGIIGIGLAIYLPFTTCGDYSNTCSWTTPCEDTFGNNYCCTKKAIFCGDSQCVYKFNKSEYLHVCSSIAIPMGILLGLSLLSAAVVLFNFRKQRKLQLE